jgi:hypothetical protein
MFTVAVIVQKAGSSVAASVGKSPQNSIMIP